MSSGAHARIARTSGNCPGIAVGLFQSVRERLHRSLSCNTFQLISALKLARSSEELLLAIAARSYIHENGFAKIVLPCGVAGQSLRLHLWPRRPGLEFKGNVHNHCWDFKSCVVAGELIFEEFDEHFSGDVARHYAYVPSNSSGVYTLENTEQRSIRMNEFGVREIGCVYQMRAETLHRTWGKAGHTTVTLVSQDRRRRSYADVYIFESEASRLTFINKPMTCQVLVSLMDEVIATAS
jgi:hypothetical protein